MGAGNCWAISGAECGAGIVATLELTFPPLSTSGAVVGGLKLEVALTVGASIPHGVTSTTGATGATMMAALHSLRQRHPAKLVCAIPVASPESLAAVRALADDVVCLTAPENFEAVGQFYRDFRQVEDDEVIALLAQ
jgi:hypothetical protein